MYKGDILFVKFEDEYHGVAQVQEIAKFLNLDVSNSFCEKILEAVDLKELKTNAALSDPSIKVGGGLYGELMWQKWFTVHQNSWFDKKYKKLYESMSIPMHYEFE